MGQISYGTITITDTTDIAEIYMIYGGSISDTDSPTWSYNAVTGGTIWKRNISEITDYDYIWQSTVITKSGINITSDNWTDFYNTPICITGPEGRGGAPGKGISNIAIQYCNYGTGTPNESYSGWQNTVPSYDSSKPNYWTKTTITYTEGSPFVKIVKDNGITDAMATANAANTTATSANANATEALNKVQAKYATSSTSATTAAKVATINPAVDNWSLFNGAEIFVKFTYKNNVANPTLSIKPSSSGSGTTPKSIMDSDGNTLAEKFYWKDNSLVHFVYDGTYWRILDIVTTEKYNNLVTDISGLSLTVGEHTTSIDSLGTRVGATETNITQNATSITSLASNQATYTAPDGSTQTNTIASAISQNANNIDLKVSKDGVIQAINISNEGITIDADKVNITGAAIFTSGRLSETSLNNAYRDAYAISESSGSSSAKTTQSNTPAGFTLYDGATVTIKFNNANTATTPTLNVNGTGAKTIKSYTGAALTVAEYQWPAGAIITFVYDGNYWRMQDEGALQSVAEVAGNLTTEINQRKANYGTCETTYNTRDKVVTCDNFELIAGNEVMVYFHNSNNNAYNTYTTYSIRLNVNNKGLKDVWVAGAVTSSTNQLLWADGAYITFKYDGSKFIVVGEPRSWYGASTTTASTAAKTDTTAVTGCVICKGAKIELAMTNNNTSTSATLNIRSTGAKAIYYGNTTTRPTVDNGHSWLSGSTATFTFDGQYYRMAGQTVINGDSITTGTINSNRIDVAGIITANGIVTNTLTGGTINTNNYIRVSTENLGTPISVGLSDEKQDWRIIAGTNFGVDQQGYTYAAELILNNGVTGTNLVNASKLVDKYEKILTVTEEDNTNSISTNLSIHQFQENTSDVEEQTQSNYIQTQLNFESNRLAFTQNIIDNTNSTDITTIEVAHIDATNDGIFYIEKLKPTSIIFGELELIEYNKGLGIRRRS